MGSLLSKKFPVFRVSGIQVNVHILFLIFAGVELYQQWDYPGIAILCVATLWLSVLLHEFGHCWGARYQGGDATEVILWPLGGLALCEAPQTPWAQGFVAAAGPMVNVVLALAAWGLSHVVPPISEGMWKVVGFHPISFFYVVLWTNVSLFTFNMLPAFPMDMGRIAQAVMWVWMGFKKSLRLACYLSFICAFGLIVWSIADRFVPTAATPYIGGFITFMIAVWVAQTAFNELQKLEAGYYDDADEPWRATFRYHPVQEPTPREPGFVARWVQKREQEKARRETEAQEARAARLDEVLRRVAQVGMDGLTAEEKSFLEQESARLREKR